MIGTSSRLKAVAPRMASLTETACGPVTMMPPVSGTLWARLNCASPVPGGRSTIRSSNSPQRTSVKSCWIALCSMGPRQTTASPSGMRKPMLMTSTP